MEVVTQEKPLSMGWCLDCHRNPTKNLRPLDQITNMTWQPSPDLDLSQEEIEDALLVSPPEDCSACHR